MNTVKELIYQTVCSICSGKIQKQILPATASFVDIVNYTQIDRRECKTLLRQLCKENKISWHKTLNSTAFFPYETKQN